MAKFSHPNCHIRNTAINSCSPHFLISPPSPLITLCILFAPKQYHEESQTEDQIPRRHLIHTPSHIVPPSRAHPHTLCKLAHVPAASHGRVPTNVSYTLSHVVPSSHAHPRALCTLTHVPAASRGRIPTNVSSTHSAMLCRPVTRTHAHHTHSPMPPPHRAVASPPTSHPRTQTCCAAQSRAPTHIMHTRPCSRRITQSRSVLMSHPHTTTSCSPTVPIHTHLVRSPVHAHLPAMSRRHVPRPATPHYTCRSNMPTQLVCQLGPLRPAPACRTTSSTMCAASQGFTKGPPQRA